MSDTLAPVLYRNVEETKSATLAATKVDLPGDQPGTFSAFVNVTNIIDHDNDKILPGAFQASLAQRNPKVFWGHDPNVWIGKTLQAEELLPGDPRLPDAIRNVGGGALWVRGQFNLDTQAGREAYSNAKFFGEDVEWSVGFRIPADSASFDAGTKVRTIEKVDLYEYSMVYAGASPGTHTHTIKETAVATELKEDLEDNQWVEFVLEDGTVLRGVFRIVPPEDLQPVDDSTDTTGSDETMSDSTKAVDDATDAVADAYAKGREDALTEFWLNAEWVRAEWEAWCDAEAEWKAATAVETVVDDGELETTEAEPVPTVAPDPVDDDTADADLADDDTVDTTITVDADTDAAEIEALLLENDIAGGDLL